MSNQEFEVAIKQQIEPFYACCTQKLYEIKLEDIYILLYKNRLLGCY